MTTATLIIHLDIADGEVVWWAESPEAPGFTAVAGSLAELRDLAQTGLCGFFSSPVRVTERLVGNEVQTDPSGRQVRIAKELVA